MIVQPVPLRRDPVLIALGLVVLVAFVAGAVDTGGHVVRAVVWPTLILLCGCVTYDGFRILRSPEATAGERRMWAAASLAGAIFVISDSRQFAVFLRDPTSMVAAVGGPLYGAGIFVGTLCIVVALLAVPLGFATRHERARFLLDAATVLVFAATLGCYFVVAAGAAGIVGAGRTVSLLFGPAIYVVAAFALVKLLLMPVKPFTPLTGALSALAATLEAAATGFRPALVAHGHIPWHQAGTIIAVAALAGAARVQHLQMRSGGPGRTRASRRPYSLLPYAAVVGTYVLLIGVLAVNGWQTATWIVVIGSAASSALVVVRQLTAFAENAQLLAMLDAKVTELHSSLTERDRLASELEHLAFHDALTGLANRGLFQRRLDGHGAGHAVLLVDLDGFKPINDTYGHAAGDAVLAAVALRLSAFAAPGDLVARLGGDEFALLSAAPLTHAEGQARATDLAAAIRLPMTVRGQQVQVGASVGVAIGHGGQSGTDLLHDADLAMYREKANNRRRSGDPGADPRESAAGTRNPVPDRGTASPGQN